jgi:DNA-binding NtrC family response regulator
MLEYAPCLSVYHREVEKFKKQLLQTTLEAHRGNRTRAARALGLQRTYFLRLIRNFEINVPHE